MITLPHILLARSEVHLSEQGSTRRWDIPLLACILSTHFAHQKEPRSYDQNEDAHMQVGFNSLRCISNCLIVLKALHPVPSLSAAAAGHPSNETEDIEIIRNQWIRNQLKQREEEFTEKTDLMYACGVPVTSPRLSMSLESASGHLT